MAGGRPLPPCNNLIRLVLTTFASPEDAEKIVRLLVSEKLAACGTIFPGVRSIYLWEGKIADSQEASVLLKTTVEQFPALEKRLQALHPYETPEIIALDPAAVSDAYATWVRGSCQLDDEPQAS